jgi:hypothetical protein
MSAQAGRGGGSSVDDFIPIFCSVAAPISSSSSSSAAPSINSSNSSIDAPISVAAPRDRCFDGWLADFGRGWNFEAPCLDLLQFLVVVVARLVVVVVVVAVVILSPAAVPRILSGLCVGFAFLHLAW